MIFPFLLVSVVACLICLPWARAGEVSHARIVRLSYALGDVQASANGASGWQKAIANTPLREGMGLATGDGRAEIEFEEGAMAWMASHTVLDIPQLTLEDGAKNTQLAMKQGTATFYVSPARHDSFAVEAGGLMISAQQSARFRVDVFEDGAAISVLRGDVDVAVRGASQHLSGHTTLALRNDSSASPVVSGNPHGDAWDRWVSDRYDSVDAARLHASDNMSAPFSYGMADLGFYGNWINVPGYGLGWQPYGVGAGWSPFYSGYWDTFGAGDPTWISYEPWGWLPYHYGGWAFSPVFGWVWQPTGFGAWSPATVFWTSTPSGLAWVARAPRETLRGTPVNAVHGVVMNTPSGMRAGLKNAILSGPDFAKSQMSGIWKGDGVAEAVSPRAPLQPRAVVTGAASAQAAQRMPPAGAAPRIANAGIYAGRVQIYQPPVAARSPANGFGPSAPPSGGPGASASSSAPQSDGASSHASSGSSGGGKVKP